MFKQVLRISGALVFALAVLAGSPRAFAGPTIKGSVYQITPNDVYVEMADHTAVRVANDSATFLMHGAPIDITDLRRGYPVTVEYLPKTTVTTTTYRLSDLPRNPTGTVSVTRDTRSRGRVVHHYWADGSWHVRG
jgi:hypothetical protein